ncbi:MAG TPA: phage tail protein [Pseudonocardiaceae bacterium]
MPIADGTRLGLSTRFRVVVQDVDLGGWATCRGLLVDFRHEMLKEGGHYDGFTIMPDRVLYSPISLSRAMNATDSAAVHGWLQRVVREWYADSGDGGYTDHTAQITLLDAHQETVMTWRLRNVYPLKWRGPDLDAQAGNVAIETLDLAHEGFL